MTETKGLLLPLLEVLVLERTRGGGFVLCDDLPAWCRRLGWSEPRRGEALCMGDLLPFVEAFLPDAERAWAGAGASRVDSGLWTRTTAGGEEICLEATALRAGDRALLLVTPTDAVLSERRQLLQRAREIGLAHDALCREIERKDVLIHCIVHDLAGPLNSMLGTLSLFSEQPLSASNAALIDVALKAALRQRQLIGEILDTFAAERGALDVVNDSVTAPDLRAAVAQVIEGLSPMATSLGIRLVGPPGGALLPIVGEERRLGRVLVNLVQNALRFSPRGATVRVLLHDEPGGARVTVDDEGPGVPPAVATHLFEKFARGGDPGAGTGLGLYFCRITVEHWGGGIGYEPRPEAGSRFWIRLRCVGPPAEGSNGTARGGGAWRGS